MYFGALPSKPQESYALMIYIMLYGRSGKQSQVKRQHETEKYVQLMIVMGKMPLDMAKVRKQVRAIKDRLDAGRHLIHIYGTAQSMQIRVNIWTVFCYHPGAFIQEDSKLDILKWGITQAYRMRQHFNTQPNVHCEGILLMQNSLTKGVIELVSNMAGLSEMLGMTPEGVWNFFMVLRWQCHTIPINQPISAIFEADLVCRLVPNRHIASNYGQVLRTQLLGYKRLFESCIGQLQPPTQKMMMQCYLKILQCTQCAGGIEPMLQSGVCTTGKLMLAKAYWFPLYYRQIEPSCFSCEEDFQLLTELLGSDRFHVEEVIEAACKHWLQSWHHLSTVQEALLPISEELPADILTKLYFQLSTELQIPDQSQNEALKLSMWEQLLKQSKMQALVYESQPILMNLQLTLLRFLRRITGDLTPQLSELSIQRVLSVYHDYSSLILLQQECHETKLKVSHYLIEHFPQYLTRIMLVLPHIKVQYPSLEHYHADLMALLIQQCGIHYQFLPNLLPKLEKQVGEVLLKYLIHHKLINIGYILGDKTMLDYTISTGIELHLHHYEHLLQKQLLSNLTHHVSLISRSPYHSTYSPQLNHCLSELLNNQTEPNNSNVRLLGADATLITYVATHLSQLDCTPQAIIKYAIKSLYANCPQIAAVMLVRVMDKWQGDDREWALAEVMKFITIYHSSKSYQLVGLIMALILIHGTPFKPNKLDLSSLSQLKLSTQQHFLPLIAGILQQSNLISHPQFQFTFKDINIISKEDYYSLMTALRKCLAFGLMSHVSLMRTQESSDLNLLQNITEHISLFISKDTSTYNHSNSGMEIEVCEYKRIIDMDFTELEQEHKVSKVNRSSKTSYKLHTTKPNLEVKQMVEAYTAYDEFSDYKQLVRMWPVGGGNEGIMNKQRVHGKVRTIVKVKKEY